MTTPANPDDLLAFLHQQLDKDERMALDAGGRRWRREAISCVVDAADNGLIVYGDGPPTPEQADHIVRWDPARVLAEVDAKRRILDWIEGVQEAAGDPPGFDPQDAAALTHAARLLALPFADREGFREEWRP